MTALPSLSALNLHGRKYCQQPKQLSVLFKMLRSSFTLPHSQLIWRSTHAPAHMAHPGAWWGRNWSLHPAVIPPPDYIPPNRLAPFPLTLYGVRLPVLCELLPFQFSALRRARRPKSGYLGLDFAASMERTTGSSAHRYMLGWCVWLKIGWVCLSTLSSVQAMTLDVPDGGESCVIIRAEEGDTINANFEVT